MRVGVDRTKYSVQIPLPPKIDPTVRFLLGGGGAGGYFCCCCRLVYYCVHTARFKLGFINQVESVSVDRTVCLFSAVGVCLSC